MTALVLDFCDDHEVAEKVQVAVRGAKSRTEVLKRLQGCVIKPKPGRLSSVEGRGDGFDVLFIIGEGQRPRVVHCVESNFDDLA